MKDSAILWISVTLHFASATSAPAADSAASGGSCSQLSVSHDGQSGTQQIRSLDAQLQKILEPALPPSKASGPLPEATLQAFRDLFSTRVFNTSYESRLQVVKSQIDKVKVKDKERNTHSLTDEELVALYGYTDGDYRILNGALRDPKNQLNQVLDPYFQVLNSALSKLPIHPGKVLRGDDLPIEVLGQLEKGKTIPYQAFTSTSMTYPFPKRQTFTILSKRGRSVEEYSAHRDEREVLFKEGTKFKVIRIYYNEPGQMNVQLEEMTPEEMHHRSKLKLVHRRQRP